ncbi:midasin [Scaptodrosophila lebanonensis]|uniref:Midasin n=1 Tax=Drosophila lebanonensis TaxID=7225 RepID=A0A6J2T169_DROLE|nr:midasin [Scaptodrosophila lebanonensis]
MEVHINKLRCSVRRFLDHLQAASAEPPESTFISHLQQFTKKQKYTEKDVEQLFRSLAEQLTAPAYTLLLAVCFNEQLLLLLTTALSCEGNAGTLQYQLECIALAKLLDFSGDARRFSKRYFRKKSAPFEATSVSNGHAPSKKAKHTNASTELSELELIKCCFQLLKSDATYFRELWDWSLFISQYAQRSFECKLTELYYNHTMAILTNMSSAQLYALNASIPTKVQLKFEEEQSVATQLIPQSELKYLPELADEKVIKLQLPPSQRVTNIEGVLLPIFNKDNHEFYAATDGSYDRIVKVDSTVVNLRSIALGVSADKPICLSGPVGCGKTTLIEYLARKTGRICPKPKEIKTHESAKKEEELLIPKRKTPAVKNVGDKRKIREVELDSLLDLDGVDPLTLRNGFLRIQLGDQTDSKMLLGQYRCTDVPGEFIWLPGVLTQAVMHGYWLLLEDLDAATQDTYTILSSLLERNYLSVPGFRDCVKIEPGFQLFVTVRTNKSASTSSQKSLFTLLEKYLYTINILPLSRNELCKVVSTNYPKLSTVANRVVDVFLTFSSGDHTSVDNLRQQETGDKADTTEKYTTLPFEQVTISSMPNSGRLVSTRDLIKLCQRSNPQFSVTNAECAYFVFQNAVDVFCSYLPQSKEKTALITSIGAKLGIIRSRCDHFANEHKPEVEFANNLIKIGRTTLCAKSMDEVDEDEQLEPQALKRQKLTQKTERTLNRGTKQRTTFSFTRLASCLLERIAVCVSHAEPVLLVGETGVGKTSSVQYLAERTEHKLVVVNMNNQSDVSDLVGGYKPVELNYVLAPLRYEFEYLFGETFNLEKNQDFLRIFATHFNSGRHTVIIKSMLNICANVGKKTDAKLKLLLPKWEELQTKLQKLQTQLDKSINISFAFIPGSLVNCIKNGDWVLLDEINLASAETLECLSTILEPEGSVVLLERGDFTPVKRHADFRIFACMNPNTDIGKKDLPVGIRNRFTEFFVDELTTDADLSLLVGDYLSNTGIQRKSVHGIVQLYKSLKRLSELQLNDGLGNRPVYSLRTLCRSLRICAKNLCGSIERNLYESFCLSFLTQLDPESHELVLLLIKDALLRNAKAVLMQELPRLGDSYMQFEGYWIQLGTHEPQECVHYILTESVRKNLKDLARIISIGKLPVLLQGPTSAGKTSLIEYVAKRSGNHCLRINNHEHTDLQEYIGTYAADVTGKLTFQEGVLVQAMRRGYWIILDELNLASTDILEALNRVLDDNRELFIAETQTVVKAHPNFMLFATQNPPGLYGGRKTLSRAFKNRFIELHFADIPRGELEIILEKRCLIPASYAKKMVLCMSDLQKNRKTTSKNVFTLRDLFRWGNRYTYADKSLQANSSYDWNQHLIEEGYLVLSAKVRTPIEIDIIEDTLYRNFRKRVNLEQLFDVNTNLSNSPVTNKILDAIRNFKQRADIVWTRNMTRMAVLTAKALQFDEPVLLVGPTGCGKTTVCQLLASIANVQLRILNCHMHTEGADFLGGLRPCRERKTDNNQQKLFEWADGPLIYAMQEGSYFMADEISLAEDSVLERLNCILEPERTVLLAEKGGVAETDPTGEDFVVKAKSGFQFLATMNPGGDFGKKELSPALRNRFTEIWCLPSSNKEDLVEIAYNCMGRNELSSNHSIAEYLVEIVLYIRQLNEKFKFSVRDVLAWSNYMVSNADLSFPEQAIFGLETIFLDALEMLPYESDTQIERLKANVIDHAIKKAAVILKINFNIEDISAKRGKEVQLTSEKFGIQPFFLCVNPQRVVEASASFLFDAPTTKRNLFRLLSALSLRKPVLLEGPPGVGKTSIVESIAHAIGYQIVRINLCEHTDLADLFGTDLPAEDNLLNISSDEQNKLAMGSFVWRDGPLLAALKAPNTWILLDELNLAPQSVLEGLNAVLDHRGEVYIPELNKSFLLGNETRIFACQNPLKQGGGRKGLPQSFLNRFTKVYLRKLTKADLLHVVNAKYAKYFEELSQHFQQLLDVQDNVTQINLFDIYNSNISPANEEAIRNKLSFDLAERLVKFSEILDCGVSSMEFGYKGGPYEFNLRDILRWCDLLHNSETGYIIRTSERRSTSEFQIQFQEFLLTLYERMKLVYYQRMRSEQDHLFIRNAFARVFNCDAEQLNVISEDVGLYWTADSVYLNDVILHRKQKSDDNMLGVKQNQTKAPLLLSSQRQLLKQIVETVHMEKPLLLCGATDSGKTKLIDAYCVLSNQICNTDTIDDSVTGSFQQIDLNRHLEQISRSIEALVLSVVQNTFLKKIEQGLAIQLFSAWSKFNVMAKQTTEFNEQSVSEELQLFNRHLCALNKIIDILEKTPKSCRNANFQQLSQNKSQLLLLQKYISNTDSLNTGGSFEWVDSKVVQSLKFGQHILLEHVNLCSSAVLDRLNPVFEPQGSLLIAEKGISTNDSAEVVQKSQNFRAFLTIDPKNGELSRAMRNRCVELAVHKNSYTIDDMRAIVHSQGVHQIAAINCMLRIHKNIVGLTELNGYSISHLTQLGFLSSAYNHIGYELSRAIYVSAMEVYVYSATTDLLGYGLPYYQNKLRELVLEQTETYAKQQAINPEAKLAMDPLSDVILNCGHLTTLTLIKLQAAPLKVLLQARNEVPKEQLAMLFQEMDALQLSQLNATQLARFFLYLMYEVCALDELELRHIYLQSLLGAGTDLQQLSVQLYEWLKRQGTKRSSTLPQLPWNRKLLPRLRDYATQEQSKDISLALSASLLSRLLLCEIPKLQLGKLQQLDALEYSQALLAGNVTNKFTNGFLTHLSTFLVRLQQLLFTQLTANDVVFELHQYAKLIINYLWFNRLLTTAQQTLLCNNQVNVSLMHKLVLHFKWLEKHLLGEMRKICEECDSKLGESLQGIKAYVEETRRPLNVLCKIYSKQFTHFQPYYMENQIALHTKLDQLQEQLNVVPNYGKMEVKNILMKFLVLKSEKAHKWRAYLRAYTPACSFKPFEMGTQESSTNFKLQELLKNLCVELKANQTEVIPITETTDLEFDIDSLLSVEKGKEEKEQESEQTTQLKPYELLLDALREYLMSRILTKSANNDFDNLPNGSFCEQLLTLNGDFWQCLNTLNSGVHASISSAWRQVCRKLEGLESIDQYETLLQELQGSLKGLRTYQRQYRNAMQCYQLNNLARRLSCVQPWESVEMELDSRYSYEGPALVNVLLALVFRHDGSLKPVPLNELDSWRSCLRQTRQLLWHNASLLTSSYNTDMNNVGQVRQNIQHLLQELQYVLKIGNEKNSQIEQAMQELQLSEKHLQSDLKSPLDTTFEAALSNTLIGAVELCLLTYMPLIDPVEKNRWKNLYVEADIQCLSNLTTVYDFMRIIMKYKHFGHEIYEQFMQRFQVAREQQRKLSQKLALRPEQCLYANLVQDVTHFMQSNCELQTLVKFVNTIRQEWRNFEQLATDDQLKSGTETLNKIELWLANARRFVHHTLSRYNAYYQDFVQPIKCALNQMRFGLEHLKVVFTQAMLAGSVKEAQQLQSLLSDMLEFPAVKPLMIQNNAIYGLLSKLQHCELEYFSLLKAKLIELRNCISVASTIDEPTFAAYDFALRICNQTWQKEEERRIKQREEAESLYVTKTCGGIEDDELVELKEIESIFPTNVDEDFGEFVTQPTLENVLKLNKKHNLKEKIAQIVNEEDYAFLARNFIEVMTEHTQVSYHRGNQTNSSLQLQLLVPYQARLQVCVKLYAHFKNAMNERLDERAYNSLAFALALQQRSLNDIVLEEAQSGNTYDFYKDSNLTEVVGCTNVLDRIEKRVLEQLELYPEHAGLADINLVISRIRNLPSTASVVRFNTGFQLLRQKLALWNEVAHRNNNLQQEEIEVAEYVQRWTKLELQHWRNCLSRTAEQVEQQAYRYWFFIYNLLQQFIEQKEMDQSYRDIKYAEKRFVDGEHNETDTESRTKVETPELIRILRQFVEASCYGDFHVRLQLLHAFEMYVHNVLKCRLEVDLKPLIAGLHNLQIYFAQFASEVQETNKSRRAPIEKKMREFVKIQSYTKDLSYFSMRNNVASVHRNLNKFLKEYRSLLQEKITGIFQPKDATAKDYNFNSDKGKNLRHYNKMKYFMIDQHHFLASEKLRLKYSVDDKPTGDNANAILHRLGKHFGTARNIVKETLGNMQYGELLNSLDELLEEQLERCEYLRNLNVDRSKERAQQKLEAKQILQQKRKALSDLFKTLTQLGISYKTGLMELTLRTEFENFQTPPFCIKSMLCMCKEQRLHPNALQLNEHLNLYYMKCVFKLKLLQNIMLTPLSELGPPNIERIKGFSVDLFLLVQQQRHQLANATGQLHELRKFLQNLRDIFSIISASKNNTDEMNFAYHQEECLALKEKVCRIYLVVKQFKLLLAGAPVQEVATNIALANQNLLLVQTSPHFTALLQVIEQVINSSQNMLSQLEKDSVDFIANYRLKHLETSYQQIVGNLEKAVSMLHSSEGEHFPQAQPLYELLAQVSVEKDEEKGNKAQSLDLENVETELANIAHNVLLALQKIFKKHPKLENILEDGQRRSSPTKKQNEITQLQERHLKQRLSEELDNDWQLLGIDRILGKVSNVLMVLKYASATNEKLACLQKATALLPLLEQYQLLADYFFLQQLGTHKISAKMLSIMLTVFVEIGINGFCVPADLMQDEEGQSKQDSKKGEGFGLEDGSGENDASDKIENEDQLDDAKRPEDRKDDGDKQEPDCKEEKGIDMSEDFDGKMQDIEKPENEEDDSGESEDEEDLNKEMGETEDGAEKLDEQIWGDNEEEEKNEQDEMNDEDQGKGTKDEKDAHNDLDTKNDAANEDGKDEHEKDGLDATNEPNSEDKRKEQAKDIDDIRSPDVDEEQTNVFHNELEEPPEPEEMDLGDMNNVDEGRDDVEDQGDENPFDIDVMKENNPPENKEDEEKDNNNAEELDNDMAESENTDSEAEETGKETEPAQNGKDNENEESADEDLDQTESQKRGELEIEQNEDEVTEHEELEKREEKPEEHSQSKDKSSKEENVQSVPESDQNSSADQVQSEKQDQDVIQDQKMDEQDTGEEKDGVGQAENDSNDGGHQGIAETKEAVSQEDRKNERQTQEKRKQGRTNEERTLGEAEKNKLKQLKTIDKLKENNEVDADQNESKDINVETDEYQHVKEPKNSDKTTLDNATEEQSKQIMHQEDEQQQDDSNTENENTDELMDIQDPKDIQEDDAQVEKLGAEKTEQRSDKPSKTDHTKEQQMENAEEMEVEGEVVPTMTVPRSTETTAHTNNEIIDKTTAVDELTTAEQMGLHQMYQQQIATANVTLPHQEDYEAWQSVSNRMAQNARELCEQLRLILEPTKCTRLKGDYRTGRRINMKKIIPYIASQFRKDKIWLRRTKPAQRDYKITIAIDDSKSMHHNNSKTLTLEAISLVSQALTLLESGRLSIVSFGESPKIILNHTEQFDGPRLVNVLNFAQDKTKIAGMLDFIRTVNSEEASLGGDNGLFENLLLILSDGRNIFSEGNQKVKNSIKLARLQRIFLVYIIIDNPDNKNSILDIQHVELNTDGSVNINSYLDSFPFPYYVIVRDLNQLPLVLSEAMRQWFELVNSEQ